VHGHEHCLLRENRFVIIRDDEILFNGIENQFLKKVGL
jgi:hypothetical protein